MARHETNSVAIRELIRLAQAGDMNARTKLVEDNLPLVASVVRRFLNRGYDYDDLFQAGALGLLKAILGFDLSFDVQFSTYAVPMIIGEIKRWMREDTPLHISRSLRELAARATAAQDELSQSRGRKPTVQELAEYLEVSVEELVSAMEALSPVRSLSEHIGEDDDEARLENIIPAPANEEGLALRRALKSLEPAERAIIILRYFAEKSQAEVAELLGVSQAQVSRLEKRIVAELRHHL